MILDWRSGAFRFILALSQKSAPTTTSTVLTSTKTSAFGLSYVFSILLKAIYYLLFIIINMKVIKNNSDWSSQQGSYSSRCGVAELRSFPSSVFLELADMSTFQAWRPRAREREREREWEYHTMILLINKCSLTSLALLAAHNTASHIRITLRPWWLVTLSELVGNSPGFRIHIRIIVSSGLWRVSYLL